jgi:hypothetical protein
MQYSGDPYSETQRNQPPDEWNALTRPMQPVIAAKLEEIRQASRQGQRERAYVLSKEVTELAPDSPEGWIYRAALTGDLEQRFIYLNKAVSLSPGNIQAQHGMYETLKSYLNQDPFLRYLDEDNGLYRALTGEGRAINVPKDRATVVPYPPKEPSPLKPVFRWLLYTLLGLLLSGLITVICAPVAMARAWQVMRQPVGVINQRRAIMMLVCAGVLWIVGLFLSLVFVLHVLAY